MLVRKVKDTDDFEALAYIYVKSWQTAYRGIVPQDYLDGLESGRWAGVLAERKNDAYAVLDEEVYAGTASICPARDKDMAGWGEIISIYLLPRYFGKGYAWSLFRAAVGGLRQKGFQRICLWVLEENAGPCLL